MQKVPDCPWFDRVCAASKNWFVNLNATLKIHLLKRGNAAGEPRSNYNTDYSNKYAATSFNTASRALQEMVEHFGNLLTHSSPCLKTPLYASLQIYSSTMLKIKLTQFENLRKKWFVDKAMWIGFCTWLSARGPYMAWRPFKRTSGGEGSHLHRVKAKWLLYKTWISFTFTAAGLLCCSRLCWSHHSKSCNYNSVSLPQLHIGSPHFLPQGLTVLNSVVA